jgi:hypothetical protein
MHFHRPLIAAATLLAGATSAFAQATIDHNKALAGGINPGDAPGYPITLSQPGSYKLMSNLVVPAGQGGVEITANNVTLDLNGFSIVGPRSCSCNDSTKLVTCTSIPVATAGIALQGDNLQLRRGTVQGFTRGVQIGGRSVVEDISVFENTFGVLVQSTAGKAVRLSGITASVNELHGVWTQQATGHIERSVASANGVTGFYMGSTFTLMESTADLNGQYGVRSGAGRGVRASGNGTSDFDTNFRSMGGNMAQATAF